MDKKSIELLAPAGNMECLKTALYFGADAVYLAGKQFGLRAFADNFSMEELKEASDLAHFRGKKLYLTVNRLFRNDDFKDLDAYLADAKMIGIDAVIVSDPGVICAALKAGLEVHLSTQASTMNARSAEFWHDAGVKRIVLAREITLEEISQIHKMTPDSLELEVFIHGAMCIAYSGRCLLSSVFTGRSGNRGECAQPCRWKYTIHEAGYPDAFLPIEQDEGGTYLLNSRDLKMLEHIPELISSGATSFKIEGRMKSAYYVGCVVNAYRRAIDEFFENPSGYEVNLDLVEELDASATRRFTTGFFFGNPAENGQDLVRGLTSRKFVFCGRVLGQGADGRIRVEQRGKFSVGDTLRILSPNMGFETFIVSDIWNERGEPQPSAPHPQQIIEITCPFALKEGDLLRKVMIS